MKVLIAILLVLGLIGGVTPSAAPCRALFGEGSYGAALECFYGKIETLLAEELSLEPPVQAVKETRPLGIFTAHFLTVTAKVDSLVLRSVSVNRGNCRFSEWASSKLPVTLKFGDRLSFGVDCDPIEATFVTDKGSHSLTWKQ